MPGRGTAIGDVPATHLRSFRLLMRGRLACGGLTFFRLARVRMLRFAALCERHGGCQRDDAQRPNEVLHGILIDGIRDLYRPETH